MNLLTFIVGVISALVLILFIAVTIIQYRLYVKVKKLEAFIMGFKNSCSEAVLDLHYCINKMRDELREETNKKILDLHRPSKN